MNSMDKPISILLLPYSQLVWNMEQQIPGVYDFHLTLQFDPKQVRIDQLRKAIQTAVDNHPVFALLGTKYYNFAVREEKGIGYLYMMLNRILGDGQSMIVLAEDIGRAYLELPLGKDDYVGYVHRYLANQQTERYAAHKAELIDRFGEVTYPVRPTTDFPLETEGDWILGELVVPIDGTHPSELSLNQTVCLATAMAIMDYCRTDEAALTWAYLGRETIEDQRIYGSLHKDIPMRIQRASTVKEYIRQVRQECRKGIACSDYPLTLTAPYSNIWNYAVNVLEQPNLVEALAEFPIPLQPIESEKDAPRLAYSLLDIEIEEDMLRFKYSATHYKAESMEHFAQMVVENMGWINK